MDRSEVDSNLAAYGQDHLLRHKSSLGDDQLAELYAEIAELDLNKVAKCWDEAQKTLTETSEKKDDQLEPLDRSIVGSTTRDKASVPRWEALGLDKVGADQVAVLLLAGGQGTRLGVDYPKGMYNVGLPSNKTLYQLQAERILKLQELAGKKCGKACTVPWYIMTSEHTREPTLRFFEAHRYFDLNPSNVIVFEQNTFPCLEFDGKIILADRHHLARAPDGNGGLYAALANPKTKVLADMRSRGIKCIHVYCVDNILVKMADPVFVGFCSEKGVECGAKVVQKTQPTERVGVVCRYNNCFQVVEYSEINIETAEMRNDDGTLTFSAGNICNHFFTLDFLERVCKEHDQDLTYHIAKKKIPYVGADGNVVKPTKPNGIKMEKFVFDVFQFAQSFAVLEVLREDEFSPLKNAPGADKDTPATARASLMDLHYRQLLSAGGTVVDADGKKLPLIPRRDCNSPVANEGESNGSVIVCEISPLVSYFGEGLKEICSGHDFTVPVHLECPSPLNGNGNGGPESKRPRTD